MMMMRSIALMFVANLGMLLANKCIDINHVFAEAEYSYTGKHYCTVNGGLPGVFAFTPTKLPSGTYKI